MSGTDWNILFVDDEENVLSSLRRLFHGEGYGILTATRGDEGLRVLEANPVALIIADNGMPGMSGIEFLRAVREVRPDVIRVMLTGYADLSSAKDAINRGEVYRFLTKPWDPTELRVIVKQGVEQYRLVEENKQMQLLIEVQNRRLQVWNAELQQTVTERTEEIRRANENLQQANQQLQASFVNAVRVLLDLIELRDPAMSGHSRRVATLSKQLALFLHLSGEDAHAIEAAALLHDIGKIGLPDEVLVKSEFAMAPHERALLKRHPVIGQAAMQIVDSLEPIGELIRHHHERWDGRGYPDGLRGEAIPLGARIIAVANACDHARVSGRDGVDNFLADQARANLALAFDPHLIRACRDVLAELPSTDSEIEVGVPVSALEADMVLARDLRTSTGLLLLPKGESLKHSYLSKLTRHAQNKLIASVIYVYRPAQDTTVSC